MGDYATRLRDVRGLEEIGEIVRTTVRALLQCDGATFVLREGEKCFYADEDAIAPLWKGQRFPLGECVSGWVMLHGVPAVVPDIEADPRVPIEAYRPTFVRSLATVPIANVGAIGAYWARPYQALPAEVAALQQLAAHVADAIREVGLDGAPWAPNFSGR